MVELKCPMCTKKVYTGTGFGCMMCAMPLEKSNGAKFCSDKCKKKYREIHE